MVLFYLLRQNSCVKLPIIQVLYFGLACSLHGFVYATTRQHKYNQWVLIVEAVAKKS